MKKTDPRQVVILKICGKCQHWFPCPVCKAADPKEPVLYRTCSISPNDPIFKGMHSAPTAECIFPNQFQPLYGIVQNLAEE